jgi:hypothetical protein
MAKIFGQLEKAQLENSASNPSNTASGLVYFNTTDFLTKIYNGSGWKTFVETDTAQAITNKDIDGGTASNSLRFTIPKNTTANLTGLTRKQGTVFYDTTTNTIKYDDGVSLNELASSSSKGLGQGGVVTPGAYPYTLTGGQTGVVVLVDTASARTINLPTPVAGLLYTIKDVIGSAESNNITITPATPGSQKIDGVLGSYAFAANWGEISLICDGTHWWRIG